MIPVAIIGEVVALALIGGFPWLKDHRIRKKAWEVADNLRLVKYAKMLHEMNATATRGRAGTMHLESSELWTQRLAEIRSEGARYVPTHSTKRPARHALGTRPNMRPASRYVTYRADPSPRHVLRTV